MSDMLFRRSVTALDASVVAYLRPSIRGSSRIPAPPYAGASPLSHEQALLMLSLTYGAGVRMNELARMEVDALLDEDGTPKSHVHIRPAITTQFKSRKVSMHPDIQRDAVAFRDRHPGARFIALVPLLGGNLRPEPMTVNGLAVWFRRLFEAAGFEDLTAHSGRKMFNASAREA